MTAVVRPICVYHSYLSDSRISLFNVLEIILTELDIVKVHCKTKSVSMNLRSSSVEEIKPSTVLTVVGIVYLISSVSKQSREASLDSTGFII